MTEDALQPGDQIFLSDASEGASERSGVFATTVREFGLRPVYYVGVGRKHLDSNVAHEFRKDMYASKLVVIYLGLPTQDDNIAFYYLKYGIQNFDLECILYASLGFDRALLLEDTDWLPFRWVTDLSAFQEALREDLSLRIGRAN